MQYDFSDWGAAAYWCIITMTSVGYGDVVPSTRMGRFVACFTALWGGFMMSLVVAIIASIFLLDNQRTEAVVLATE